MCLLGGGGDCADEESERITYEMKYEELTTEIRWINRRYSIRGFSFELIQRGHIVFARICRIMRRKCVHKHNKYDVRLKLNGWQIQDSPDNSSPD